MTWYKEKNNSTESRSTRNDQKKEKFKILLIHIKWLSQMTPKLKKNKLQLKAHQKNKTMTKIWKLLISKYRNSCQMKSFKSPSEVLKMINITSLTQSFTSMSTSESREWNELLSTRVTEQMNWRGNFVWKMDWMRKWKKN